MKLSTDIKANAQLWANALRSGNYKQDRSNSALWYPKAGHCCLGVAADVIVQAGGGRWAEEEGGGKMEFFPHGATAPDRAALCVEALATFGLSDDTQWDYIRLNDDARIAFTFDDIAEVVERNLVGDEQLDTVVAEITKRKETA